MKMTILRGLPASGKSTLAAEFLKAGNTVRLNRDTMRILLHQDRWTPRNERVTWEASRVLAKHFLTNGKHLVIDDTNLRPGTLESWKDLAKECGAQVEVIDVSTPLDECLRRDRSREKRVGDHVIYGMAMQYGRYPTPKNGIVIVDLDGTLCDISHRRHLVAEKPKNWPAFFARISEDALRQDVMDMAQAHYDAGREVFFVSGRPETYRDVTEAWLAKHLPLFGFGYRALFMRRASDSRDDTIIKREIYDAYFRQFDVVEVIDDRTRVIKMWRELGLNVVDVGDGTDF